MEQGDCGFRGKMGFPGKNHSFCPPPTAHPSDEKLMSLLLNGYRILASDDEKVFKIDCSDSCTTW